MLFILFYFLLYSLKDVYEDILLIDIKTANENNIEEKLWRNVFYSHIEELKKKLRKVSVFALFDAILSNNFVV
jgi:hypothetical protein